MIEQHATQSVRDHHLMNELVGYAGLFINLQKGCFPEAKKQIDCAHMNIYRTKGHCQHTFRQWSISLVTQQLGEKQIGPIWWISVALIKGILPFHRRNENLVASLLICRKLDSVKAFADLSTCRDTECLWTAALYSNCLNLKLHCSFLTLYTGTCEVFVIQQLNQYLDNKWLPFKINHSGLCLILNGIQFCHFLGLSMLSSHLLKMYGSLCSGTELTQDFALENFRWKSSGGLIWGMVKSVNKPTTFLWDWLN